MQGLKKLLDFHFASLSQTITTHDESVAVPVTPIECLLISGYKNELIYERRADQEICNAMTYGEGNLLMSLTDREAALTRVPSGLSNVAVMLPSPANDHIWFHKAPEFRRLRSMVVSEERRARARADLSGWTWKDLCLFSVHDTTFSWSTPFGTFFTALTYDVDSS